MAVRASVGAIGLGGEAEGGGGGIEGCKEKAVVVATPGQERFG